MNALLSGGLGVGALACASFVAILTLDGWTRPGYRPVYHPISALALGSRGWVQTLNFVLCGAGIAAGGVSLILGAAGGWWPTGLVITVLGLGLIASGLYSMDPMRGYPPGTPHRTPEQTTHAHRIHDHAGTVVFGAFPLTGLVTALVAPLGWALSAAGFAVTLAAGYLVYRFAVAWEKDEPLTGLWQRAAVVTGLGWVATMLLIARSTLT